ncbi:MAG: FAD-dependent oxidoreductase, partial [Candidatus Krumholzibacteriia bacterium]
VCAQPCVQKCVRVNYEAPLRIRDVKRFLANRGEAAPDPAPATPTGHRVAVVGAGPAGLACAWELARAGVAVELFEAADDAGGMVTAVIPRFRLEPEHFRRDLARIEALGVRLHYGQRIDQDRFGRLRDAFDAVFVAVGAQADRPLGIPGEDLPGVEPALAFLARARREPQRRLDGEVLVIGGGDSAMDAARTAVRLAAAGGRVRVVYRRTAAQMPAGPEEREALRAEGVTVHELRAPVAIVPAGDGRLVLRCQVMRLGAPDASGRPRPEPVPGAVEEFAADLIVPAVGQEIVCDFLDPQLAAAAGDDAGRGRDGVWLGGDLRRGPANLVTALGDGRRAAEAMLRTFGLPAAGSAHRRPPLPEAERQDRAARLLPPVPLAAPRPADAGDFALATTDLDETGARAEAARCLECDQVCDVCVSVCPNRANVSWTVAPRRLSLVTVRPDGAGFATAPDGVFAVTQARQVLHVADHCNHCGNCTTFCPTAGEPFRDKPRFALAQACWDEEDAICRLELAGPEVRLRRKENGREVILVRRGGVLLWQAPEAEIELDAGTFAVRAARFAAGAAGPVSLREAAAMAVLLDGLAPQGGEPWPAS